MRHLAAPLVDRLVEACRRHYGDGLVSLVLFGSVARGTPGPESDVDILVVAEGLPDGRMARVDDFRAVEREVEPLLRDALREGWHVELSPVFKTPGEVGHGSPLFLDMVEDAALLYDPKAFMADALERLRARLKALGSRRIWRGNAWYWDLKPDYRPGEIFEI